MKQSSSNYTDIDWSKIHVYDRSPEMWHEHRIYPTIVHAVEGSPFTIFGHRGMRLADGGPYEHAGESAIQLRKFLYHVYSGGDFYKPPE